MSRCQLIPGIISLAPGSYPWNLGPVKCSMFGLVSMPRLLLPTLVQQSTLKLQMLELMSEAAYVYGCGYV